MTLSLLLGAASGEFGLTTLEAITLLTPFACVSGAYLVAWQHSEIRREALQRLTDEVKEFDRVCSIKELQELTDHRI